MLVREAVKSAAIETKWGVRTNRNLDELLAAANPLFAVVSVPRKVAPGILAELSAHRVAVLCETPPADDLKGLGEVNSLAARGARIQVAE